MGPGTPSTSSNSPPSGSRVTGGEGCDGTSGEVSGAGSLTPGLPIDVADLTAEWFSAVLQREVHDAELLDRSSGTTGRAHIALAGEPTVPPSVFVKLAPFDELQREFVTSVGMG